ncbi:MAG: formate/nitrite transporter family protein [Anaerolineales bacterium]|nr:formate/nitrite transporter family protein [Anaerolineales bacterium]
MNQEQKKDNDQETDVDKASPRKPARRILEQEISEGLGEIRRSASGLFISGLSAGLDVGFSLFLMATMLSQTNGLLPKPVVEILTANMYAVGFIFVIVGRSELFTEHTTLSVLPVLNGRASLKSLVRLWALIYVSNLLGATIFAWLAAEIGPALGIIQPETFGEIAHNVVGYGWLTIVVSGMLAGWLMGLLSWLVAAGRDTISQIVLIWLITAAIGLTHLHHSIVGSVEVLAGLFANQGITLLNYLHFLLWATLGNSIGGVFFVALIKYGHVIRSDKEPEDVRLEDTPQQ